MAGSRQTRTENVLAMTLAALLCAVLVTSHAVGGVLAKYTAGGTSTDTARVALFGHSERVSFDGWAATLVPGKSQTLTLTVSNARGASVSEVAQGYEIELEVSGNLPLTYKLERVGGSNRVAVPLVEETTPAGKTLTAHDDAMTFSAGDARTDTYVVTATWPQDQSSASLENVPDFLQANINVTQID